MKEFHVKEPFYIFFNNIKEISEFCKEVRVLTNFFFSFGLTDD